MPMLPLRMPLSRRALVVLGVLLAVVLGSAAPASAHAALLKTTPGEGAVLKTAPTRVELIFSEGVLLSDESIRVLDPDGRRADSGTARATAAGDRTAAVALRTGLPDGTYTVAWKAVSADSHPVAGAFTFSIGAPSKTAVALPQQQADGGVVGTLYGIARYLSYVGYALVVGASLFLGVCWPRGATLRPMQRLVAGGWAAMTAATLALLMLRGPYANGSGLGDAFDLGVIRDALETRPGAALLSRLLLLAAGAVFIAVLFGSYARREDSVERQDLAWGLSIGGTVVAGGLAATWAMAEHASVGIQAGIAMPVDMLHLLAMAVWLGGLVALLTALFKAPAPAIEREAVQRFSRIGFAAVATLVATGLYQSWRQVGSWNALLSTSYGRLLCVKVGLVVLLIELAWLSRRWTARLGEPKAKAEAAATATAAAHRPARVTAGASAERTRQLARQEAALAKTQAKKARDADPERTGLRRSVLAELAVAVAVLAVTTVLTGTQPGRAAAEQTAGGQVTAPATGTPEPLEVAIPFDTGGAKGGKGEAQVTLDPGRSGGNELHLLITGTDGKARDVPEVKVSFTLTAKKIGPLPVTLEKLDTGHWASTSVQLPMPGKWQLNVTVRTSGIDQITETKTVKIN